MNFHIHIQGQVQGVGFRPRVYQLAQSYGLSGWVSNTLDGVHLEVSGPEPVVQSFYAELLANPPVMARVTRHCITPVEAQAVTGFHIRHSAAEGEATALLTPDVATCQACRTELRTPADRRYGYPFITCTQCGPRFSLTQALPYDRPTTTMEPFPMCAACQAEYDTPADRRYYSQTNSCPDCGISLQLYDATGTLIPGSTPAILERVSGALRKGQLVAVKGIGGYLLLADAANAGAIRRLRERKMRPAKPFALMYPDLDRLEKDAWVSERERTYLQSAAAPIVLLTLRERPAAALAWEQIAPGLRQIGVMLPYAPLFEEIIRLFPVPLVATSANISHSPIIFSDEKALTGLRGIADLLLMHTREIVVPQDDSVVRISYRTGQLITIRRSRGYAPTFIQPDLPVSGEDTLAMGADLKSTFAWQSGENWYLSQYLGDLENYDTQLNYRHTLTHFSRLLPRRPQRIIADGHPGYFSAQLGEQLAREWNIPLSRVPHHEAHFAAVLAENNLIQADEPILGVIWDGTGLGTDGQIWGGEFFIYQNHRFERKFHLAEFPYLMGDKMAREPRLAALALTYGLEGSHPVLRPKFSAPEWTVYPKFLQNNTGLRTSSMGRVFDAVASLSGLADKTSYEGEAALYLEQAARTFLRANGYEVPRCYLPGKPVNGHIPAEDIIRQVLADVRAGQSAGCIAATFHNTLVESIRWIARETGIRKIAFSGGVFQNEVLVDLLTLRLNAEYGLYFHRQLSPNDECIAFGQLMHRAITRQTDG
jgi:hydrogenase maturation protein HypF